MLKRVNWFDYFSCKDLRVEFIISHLFLLKNNHKQNLNIEDLIMFVNESDNVSDSEKNFFMFCLQWVCIARPRRIVDMEDEKLRKYFFEAYREELARFERYLWLSDKRDPLVKDLSDYIEKKYCMTDLEKTFNNLEDNC